MEIRLKLFPPLSDAAGASELNLTLSDKATLKTVVDALVTRFGNRMKQHLFDRSGRIIPSWAVFLNQKIVPLNQPQALEVPVHPQDEVSFILNIAGG
ncbi:MAG: MoaD/ThiS family protein [Thermodesulfobacteriota bacterium]|jgi:molybdopterin converting factor small subunit